MPSTKDILSKGKELANKAAKSAAQSVNDYTTIPGFKDYEVNSKGILRKKSNGNVQMIPTGKKAYLLFDSSGKRRQLPNDVLTAAITNAMTKGAPAPSAKKSDGPKEPKKKDLVIDLYNSGVTDYNEIAKQLNVKANTVFVTIKTYRITDMYKNKGLNPEAIAEKMDCKVESIQNFLRRNGL